MELEEKCNKYDHKTSPSSKLDKYINRIIMKEGFVTYNVTKKEVSTDGKNFLALLYEIDVKGKTANGDKEINIFIKNMPGELNLQLISIPDVYKIELFAYQELSHIFKELQDEARVPLHERYKMVKFYDESDSELIVLDNLARKGFRTYHRMDVISLKFAEMAIDQIAKFHSLSFVIQEKRPEFFAKKIKTIKNGYHFDEDWDRYITNVHNLAMDTLDNDVKNKIVKSLQDILNKYPMYIQDPSKKRCLCHGDYRHNNILMKEINGEISEVIPIDYQLIHYGCPIFDFLYFIFGCTDREFRKEHLTHLKELYYETLGKFLQYFDMDLEILLPRKIFERNYNECLDYGLIIAMVMGPILFAAEDYIPDIAKDALSGVSFNLDAKYKDRMQGTIEEFIEKGYL